MARKIVLVTFALFLLAAAVLPFAAENEVSAQSECDTEPPYTKERLMQLVRPTAWLQRESDVDLVLGILKDSSHSNHESFMQRTKEEIERLCQKLLATPTPTPTAQLTPTATPTPTSTPKPNLLPAVISPTEGQTFTAPWGRSIVIQMKATDPENDALLYRLENSPLDMTIEQNGIITWTPMYNFRHFFGPTERTEDKFKVVVSVSDVLQGAGARVTRRIFFVRVLLPVTPTPIPNPTPIMAPTVTLTQVPTPTPTPIPSPTPSPRPTPTPTVTPSPTATATVMITPTPTATPTATPAPNPTPTPSNAGSNGGIIPSATPTPNPKPTPQVLGVISEPAVPLCNKYKAGQIYRLTPQDDTLEIVRMVDANEGFQIVEFREGGSSYDNQYYDRQKALGPNCVFVDNTGRPAGTDITKTPSYAGNALKAIQQAQYDFKVASATRQFGNPDNPTDRIWYIQGTGEEFNTQETAQAKAREINPWLKDSDKGGLESGTGQVAYDYTPVPTPVPDGNSLDEIAAELKEIEQLIQDIKTEVERQKKPQVLGVISGTGYAYPYYGIPDNFTFQNNLGYKDTGEDVRYLQIALNVDQDTRVAHTGSGSPGNETEYFGLATWNAVCKFQEKYSLEVLYPWEDLLECTGYVGQYTRAKLNQLLQEARAKRLQPLFEEGTIEQYEPPFTQEELTELTLSFTPHGAVGKLALPTKKAVLSVLKQKGDEALHLLKTVPSKARTAAREFMALVRLAHKLNAGAIEYLARHPGDALKLARIVDKYGTEVLQYIHHQGFNPSLLNGHFSRHGARLGIQSELEYELLAKMFLNRPDGGTLLAKTRANREIVRFDTVSEHFGVKAPNGTIETFYKPDSTIHSYRTNLDYFNAQ